MVDICHALEARMEEEQALPNRELMGRLSVRWQRLHDDLERFLGSTSGSQGVDVSRHEYDEALAAAVRDAPDSRVCRILEGWRNERVARQFERVTSRASALARRLVRGNIEVRYPTEEVRVPKVPAALFLGQHGPRGA